jgi:Kef-type K+ transport system membrane component KefB
MNLFLDISIVIIAATLFALLARSLKQPTIIGYLIAGVLLGPAGFSIVTNNDTITLFSELGIVFLLFLLGLEIDVKKLKGIGARAALIGVAQVSFTFLVSMVVARSLGFSEQSSAYLGIILTLSSTILVIKLYSDKNQMSTLHGRVALGILLVQDLLAVAALFVLAGSITDLSLVIAGRAMIVVAGAVALSYLAVKYLFHAIAKSGELLFVASIAWCFTFVLLAHWIHFSTAIGALIAGMILAPLMYHHEISARVRPLRDFFAPLFFVAVGMQTSFIPSTSFLIPIVIFTLLVVIGNPLIIMLIMSALGYKTKPSFMTSLSLSQVSEFSLIIATVGMSAGVITQEIFSITSVVVILTFISSAYFITYDNSMYRSLHWLVRPFEHIGRKRSLGYPHHSKGPEVIVFGAHRMGMKIVNTLRRMKKRMLVIDHDPDVVRTLMKKKVPCLYCTASDVDHIDDVPLHQARLVISTIPQFNDNVQLVRAVRRRNRHAAIVTVAEHTQDALKLYKAGAHYVILPQYIGGHHASDVIKSHTYSKLKKDRDKHVAQLKRHRNNNK